MTHLAYISRQFAERLHSLEGVPIFCYGEASCSKVLLKSIRKSLGYFESKSVRTEDGLYLGSKMLSRLRRSSSDPTESDFGSMQLIDSAKGICCVGAVELVTNFNIRFNKTDSKEIVDEITKSVRSPEVCYH